MHKQERDTTLNEEEASVLNALRSLITRLRSLANAHNALSNKRYMQEDIMKQTEETISTENEGNEKEIKYCISVLIAELISNQNGSQSNAQTVTSYDPWLEI